MSADPTSLDVTKTALRIGGTAVLAISTAIGFVSMWLLSNKVPGVDFYQFWVVGTELRHDSANTVPVNVYSEAQRLAMGQKWLEKSHSAGERQQVAAQVRPKLETFSSPLLYSVFAVLSTGDYERDHQRYCLLCLVISTVAIMGLCRLFGYSWPRTLLAATFFVGCSAPLHSDVIVTNVNQLQLGGLALFIWGQGRLKWRLRYVFCGGVLGMLLAFKPNLGLCAAFLFLTWAVNNRWAKLAEHALGIIFGLTAAFVSSAWVFSSTKCWHQWIASLRELLVAFTCPSSIGNYSLANLIEETTGARLSSVLLVILATMAATAIVRSRRRTTDERQRNPLEEDVLAISLGVTVMFLSSVLVWLHYYILLVPAALYCLRPAPEFGGSRNARYARIAMAWIAAVLITEFRPVMVHVLAALENLSVPEPVAKSILFSLGTMMLFALVVREVWSMKPQAEPATVEYPGALASAS